MRIRKRQVPFPLSSLSPVPISDPLLNLNRPPPFPVVQLHPTATSLNDAVNPNENPSHVAHPQPSDRPADHHLPLIGKGSTIINGWEEKTKTMEEEKEEYEDRSELLQEEDKREEEVEKGNHIRKENVLGAKAVSGFLQESSSNSSQVLGRWCEEGERAFPPKKRRGLSFDLNSSKTTNKTKANSNKKKPWCSSSSDTTSNTRKKDDVIDLDPSDQDAKEHGATSTKETKIVASNNSNKNKSRGGALMEGSRCSRVNGRGWRCCQQTLVGYSLCEHHLGKGRLRSMTSVRSRSLGAAKSNTTPPPRPKQDGGYHEAINERNNKGDVDRLVLAEDDDINGDEYNDEKMKNKQRPLMANNNRKRMKLGMVKARSISSLLGQSNGAIPMADLGK